MQLLHAAKEILGREKAWSNQCVVHVRVGERTHQIYCKEDLTSLVDCSRLENFNEPTDFLKMKVSTGIPSNEPSKHTTIPTQQDPYSNVFMNPSQVAYLYNNSLHDADMPHFYQNYGHPPRGQGHPPARGYTSSNGRGRGYYRGAKRRYK